MKICIVLFTFIAVVLFLVFPGARYRGDFDFTSYRYAHRGLHGGNRAENTMSAFLAAAEAGYGIELDVRLSSDGEVVVFHDDTLSRAAGIDTAVSDMAAADLAALDLFGKGEGVPKFSDVLSAVGGRVPILIEIKRDEANGTDVTHAMLEVLKEYDGPVMVQSFDPRFLCTVRKEAPEIPRGFLCREYTKSEMTRGVKYAVLELFLANALSRPQFVAWNASDRDFFAFRAARAVFRRPTYAWTVRNAEEEAELREDGFDTVIFEKYLPED